jgi:hypothetical protein
LRFSRRWLWRMPSSAIHKPSSYLKGDTLCLRYRAHPVNAVYDLKFSFLRSVRRLLVTANIVPSSPILVTWWWRRYIPPKRSSYKSHTAQHPRRQHSCIRLHGVASRRVKHFAGTIVMTANQYEWNQQIFGSSSKRARAKHRHLGTILGQFESEETKKMPWNFGNCGEIHIVNTRRREEK